jgi:hypothetical protein
MKGVFHFEDSNCCATDFAMHSPYSLQATRKQHAKQGCA